jgi:hypothetical protein
VGDSSIKEIPNLVVAAVVAGIVLSGLLYLVASGHFTMPYSVGAAASATVTGSFALGCWWRSRRIPPPPSRTGRVARARGRIPTSPERPGNW